MANESRKGVLEIKLGKCLTAPTKRMAADLHQQMEQVNVCRNAMVQRFLVWNWENKDYVPQPTVNRKGETKISKKTGNPVLEDRWLPDALVRTWNPTSLYRAGIEAAPGVPAKVVSSCVGFVVDHLNSKMPWQYRRKHKDKGIWRKKQAIAECLIQPSTYQAFVFPVPNNDSVICHAGQLSANNMTKEADFVRKATGDSCSLRFPLFSRATDRRTGCVVRLDTRQLRHKQVVHKVASGEWKLSDSQIVWKRGAFFFQLCYELPTLSWGLNTDNTAELWLGRSDGWHPFQVQVGDTKLNIGKSYKLLKRYDSLVTRRKFIQHRYRNKGSAGKGHGRRKAMHTLKYFQRAVKDAQGAYVLDVVAWICRILRKHDHGSLLYHEPSLGLRKFDWFACNGVPMDWVMVLSRLQNACDKRGIELTIKRENTKSYRDRLGDQKPPVTARSAQVHESREVAGLRRHKGSKKRGHQQSPFADQDISHGASGSCGLAGEVDDKHSE